MTAPAIRNEEGRRTARSDANALTPSGGVQADIQRCRETYPGDAQGSTAKGVRTPSPLDAQLVVRVLADGGLSLPSKTCIMCPCGRAMVDVAIVVDETQLPGIPLSVTLPTSCTHVDPAGRAFDATECAWMEGAVASMVRRNGQSLIERSFKPRRSKVASLSFQEEVNRVVRQAFPDTDGSVLSSPELVSMDAAWCNGLSAAQFASNVIEARTKATTHAAAAKPRLGQMTVRQIQREIAAIVPDATPSGARIRSREEDK